MFFQVVGMRVCMPTHSISYGGGPWGGAARQRAVVATFDAPPQNEEELSLPQRLMNRLKGLFFSRGRQGGDGQPLLMRRVEASVRVEPKTFFANERTFLAVSWWGYRGF
jgi:hypothetical protein